MFDFFLINLFGCHANDLCFPVTWKCPWTSHLSSLGGPSVSAPKGGVPGALPPPARSSLGRRRRQQSQLWHGYRWVRLSGLTTFTLLVFKIQFMLTVFIRQGTRVLHIRRHGDRGDRLDSRLWPHQHHEGSQCPMTIQQHLHPFSGSNIILKTTRKFMICRIFVEYALKAMTPSK